MMRPRLALPSRGTVAWYAARPGRALLHALMWRGRARALVLSCLVLAVAVSGHWWRTQELQRARVLQRQPPAPLRPLVTPLSPVTQFEALLLPHAALAPVVNDLQQRGQALGLVMRQGQYRVQADAAGAFARYHLSLPVSGEAGQLLRFIDEALLAHPALSLSGAQLARTRAGEPMIEARMEWVLLTTPWPPAGGT